MNFAIIGCGMIANFHARALDGIEGVSLKGVADVDYNRAKDFAKEYHITAYTTFEELLCDDSIDVVCICTPSGFHATNAIQAMRSGKHVVVEKPMAITEADADALVVEAQKNHVLLSVISQIRFSPEIQKVKRLIEDGSFGNLISANLNMMYCRTPEYYSGSTWKGTWKLDGGEMMNQGIHGIDLLRYLVGPVKQVNGFSKTLYHQIEAEDTAAAVLEFENGALGTISSTVAVSPGYERRLTICGTKGSVVLTEESIERLDLENYQYTREPSGKEKDISNPADIDIAGHLIQLQNVVSAIQGKEKLLVDAEENRETLRIIWQINKTKE